MAKDRSSAFMFDYNLLWVGYKYNDIRNVNSALNEEMKKMFLETHSQTGQKNL